MLWVLETKFRVDLTSFPFDRYFPPEFEGKNRFQMFISMVAPPQARRMRNLQRYEPLTIGMIDQAMLRGRWEP